MLIIVIGASCVTREFEYGTIKQLGTQVNHRWMACVGKHVLVLGHGALIIVVMGILKMGVSRHLMWRAVYFYH